MKKVFSFGLIILMGVLVVTGCGSKEADLKLTAKEVVEQVYSSFAETELPLLGETEITKENMAYYLGVDTLDIKEGIASEPLMGSIAHSVVVVKLNDGVDVEKAKKDIKENVDPRKWICVEAEQVIVESKGNTIILIMSNNDMAPKLQENFKNLK